MRKTLSLGWFCSLALFAAPRFTADPVIVPNPNPAVPLAAIVRFTAAEAVRTTLDVSDGRHRWQLQYEASKDPSKGLPVVGMRPDRAHEIRVSVRDAAGKSTTFLKALTFLTRRSRNQTGPDMMLEWASNY